MPLTHTFVPPKGWQRTDVTTREKEDLVEETMGLHSHEMGSPGPGECIAVLVVKSQAESNCCFHLVRPGSHISEQREKKKKKRVQAPGSCCRHSVLRRNSRWGTRWNVSSASATNQEHLFPVLQDSGVGPELSLSGIFPSSSRDLGLKPVFP